MAYSMGSLFHCWQHMNEFHFYLEMVSLNKEVDFQVKIGNDAYLAWTDLLSASVENEYPGESGK